MSERIVDRKMTAAEADGAALPFINSMNAIFSELEAKTIERVEEMVAAGATEGEITSEIHRMLG